MTTEKSESALAGAPANNGDAGSLPHAATNGNPLTHLVDRYRDAEGRKAVERITMRAALERIRAGEDSRMVHECRVIRDRDGVDAYREAKKKLTAFTFAGTFKRRKADQLVAHTGVAILDFDHLDNLEESRARVTRDPCVVFCFISPGGDGLKVGVRVPRVEHYDEHVDFWRAAADYAKRTWDLTADESGKDVSRLCFTSADAQLYMNESATVIPAPIEEPREVEPCEVEKSPEEEELGILSDGTGREAKTGDLDKARAALARLSPARADDYTSWLNVGMACKDVGLPFGEWDCWSQQSAKYDAAVCREKWDSFKSSGLTVGSLIRWARLDNGEPPTLSEAGAIEGTELWFGRIIAKQHGENLKHVWPWRSWLGWDAAAGRWRRDESGVAWAAAKQSLQRMVKSATAAAGTNAGKEALERAARFMRKTSLENSLKLAASEPEIVALPDAWDSDPYLLNCANGTVDLRDGKLREHRRGDYITKSTGISLGGDCPRWRSFLERILPDADVRNYVQRAVGYSAIGTVTEHVLHIAWGSGANGKSVFFNAITHALGDYAAIVPGSLLISDGLREHPTVIASLFCVRFALASETEEDGRIRAAQLKQLTGGDTLTARRMREDFWSFKPSHTLWLQTNHKPVTNEQTIGFWRRVRLLPFTVTIPKAEQDASLTEKLRAEAGGILAWIIEGAGMFLTDGLEPPEIVRAATDEYQKESDALGDFIEGVGLVADADGFVPTARIYKWYLDWAGTEGITKPWGRRTLTTRLMERDFPYTNKPERGFHVRCRG